MVSSHAAVALTTNIIARKCVNKVCSNLVHRRNEKFLSTKLNVEFSLPEELVCTSTYTNK
jgi:hypothetical protein